MVDVDGLDHDEKAELELNLLAKLDCEITKCKLLAKEIEEKRNEKDKD